MNSQFIVKSIWTPLLTPISNIRSHILISACTLNFNSNHISKKPSATKKILLQINSLAPLLIWIYRESIAFNWRRSTPINSLRVYLIERTICMYVSLVCLQLKMSSRTSESLERFSWSILSAFSPVRLKSKPRSASIFHTLRPRQLICTSNWRIGRINLSYLWSIPSERW